MNVALCKAKMLTGQRCDLEAGHTGSHLHVEDNGTWGWWTPDVRWPRDDDG